MSAGYYVDSFPLSSACPSSCAIVAYALRLGGKIDPDFLRQCQILDPKFQKAVDALKAIPLKFEASSMDLGYHQDMFLDMDVPDRTSFYDPWEFKQHNSWIGSPDQWNSTNSINDDIIIDFF